jgi:hypothetical protein
MFDATILTSRTPSMAREVGRGVHLRLARTVLPGHDTTLGCHAEVRAGGPRASELALGKLVNISSDGSGRMRVKFATQAKPRR